MQVLQDITADNTMMCVAHERAKKDKILLLV